MKTLYFGMAWQHHDERNKFSISNSIKKAELIFLKNCFDVDACLYLMQIFSFMYADDDT